LSTVDSGTKKIMRDAESYLKMDKAKAMQKTVVEIGPGTKESTLRKIFAAFQEILTNNAGRITFVEEALTKLPLLLQLEPTAAFTPSWTQERATLPNRALYCRESLKLFRANETHLDDAVFTQNGRTSRILNLLENIVSQVIQQSEVAENKLTAISAVPAEKTTRFIMSNSNKFSPQFKDNFYKNELERLGAGKELVNNKRFFDVLTFSSGFGKNEKGYWEARFNYGITMVYIPAGEFQMGVPWETGGAEDESPLHKVYLDGYWISKYEATFAQLDKYCKMNSLEMLKDNGRGRKKRPAFNVSWDESMKFCNWLSKQCGVKFSLPTEAQWEKAARGTTDFTFPWGKGNPNGKRANFADSRFLKKYQELNPPESEMERKGNKQWIDENVDDGHIYTAPVGSYKAGESPYGVADMAGNVWEWVTDWYDGDYYHRSPSKNPKGYATGSHKVTRGGAWDCHHWMLRSTSRAGCPPSKGNDALGFRIAVSSK
ncbi:MAG: formylglycine-generating enzyme family protein, partial [bacterium]|nr:formylglycine-generating enzyme family protein [bacterium]